MSEQDSWPTRLRKDAGATAAALREYEQQTVPGDDEAAAYARAVARLPGQRSRRLVWSTVAATVLLIPAIVVVAPRLVPAPSKVAMSPTTRGPLSDDAISVRLGPAALALSAGTLDLGEGVGVVLADGSRATARRVQGTLDLTLDAGTVALQVTPRTIGHAVLVNAGEHRFTVVGTAFRLSHDARRTEIAVGDGLVTVSRAGDHVATVAGGESWSSEASSPSPHRRGAPRLARRSLSLSECAKFSGEQTKEKLACYREIVRKGGPAGERAQHALGRYLRDDVVDLDAALAAFESQRVHYPRGELRADADRAIIEILPRLGRHAEALVETQSFLDARPDASDRAEMRLFRGDIYRAIFQDTISAEREYEEGAEAEGRTGDDSRFLRALCLEALGRVDEARLAYRDYLAQTGTAHAREAERRMRRLTAQ